MLSRVPFHARTAVVADKILTCGRVFTWGGAAFIKVYKQQSKLATDIFISYCSNLVSHHLVAHLSPIRPVETYFNFKSLLQLVM